MAKAESERKIKACAKAYTKKGMAKDKAESICGASIFGKRKGRKGK